MVAGPDHRYENYCAFALNLIFEFQTFLTPKIALKAIFWPHHRIQDCLFIQWCGHFRHEKAMQCMNLRIEYANCCHWSGARSSKTLQRYIHPKKFRSDDPQSLGLLLCPMFVHTVYEELILMKIFFSCLSTTSFAEHDLCGWQRGGTECKSTKRIESRHVRCLFYLVEHVLTHLGCTRWTAVPSDIEHKQEHSACASASSVMWQVLHNVSPRQWKSALFY